MHTDPHGLELSTRSAEAAQAIAGLPQRFAGFKLDVADRVKAALTADPHWAYAHLLRGYLLLLLGNSALLPAAAKALAAAEPLLEGGTERERQHGAALRAWIAGDLAGAERTLAAVVTRWPRDLLALRLPPACQDQPNS